MRVGVGLVVKFTQLLFKGSHQLQKCKSSIAICLIVLSMPFLLHLAAESSADVPHDSEVDSTPLGM